MALKNILFTDVYRQCSGSKCFPIPMPDCQMEQQHDSSAIWALLRPQGGAHGMVRNGHDKRREAA